MEEFSNAPTVLCGTWLGAHPPFGENNTTTLKTSGGRICMCFMAGLKAANGAAREEEKFCQV